LKAQYKSDDKDFSDTLDWQELPDRSACRICVCYQDYGMADEEHWGEIANFLVDNIALLEKSFKPLLDEIVRN